MKGAMVMVMLMVEKNVGSRLINLTYLHLANALELFRIRVRWLWRGKAELARVEKGLLWGTTTRAIFGFPDAIKALCCEVSALRDCKRVLEVEDEATPGGERRRSIRAGGRSVQNRWRFRCGEEVVGN